mmetsp:Transcript_62855/g.149767  ORF Transcript_62855/g.149767 Transcript_62855/m.149767 type:complete len:250 (-) Transcript_62855:3969-4718(-)
MAPRDAATHVVEFPAGRERDMSDTTTEMVRSAADAKPDATVNCTARVAAVHAATAPKTAAERPETEGVADAAMKSGSEKESVSPGASAIVGVTERVSAPPSHNTVALPPNDPTGCDRSIGTVGVCPAAASVDKVRCTLSRGEPRRGRRSPAESGTSTSTNASRGNAPPHTVSRSASKGCPSVGGSHAARNDAPCGPDSTGFSSAIVKPPRPRTTFSPACSVICGRKRSVAAVGSPAFRGLNAIDELSSP